MSKSVSYFRLWLQLPQKLQRTPEITSIVVNGEIYSIEYIKKQAVIEIEKILAVSEFLQLEEWIINAMTRIVAEGIK